MKQDDKLYNEWLDEVRNVQPILSNPDELTTAILQQVSRIVPRKKKRKSLLIGSWVSGRSIVSRKTVLIPYRKAGRR